MKFIFLFITIINSAWAISDISECLHPGRSIGTNYERPADIILLVPGTGTRGTILTLGHFGNLGGYFEQIENLFYDNNIEFVTVPADPKGNSSVEERAMKLRKWIRRFGLEGRQVLLIGHSLGGLVARVAARDLTLRGFISGVVTMSSPNQGDYLIDWLKEDVARNKIIHNIATAAGFEVHKKKFLFQMAVDYAANYNLLIDQSNLLPPIYSVVTYQTPKQLTSSFLPFAFTDKIMKQTMSEYNEPGGEWKGLTDGFVPAYTQVWGECIGMFNANHATSLGKTISRKTLKEVENSWIKLIQKLIDKKLLAISNQKNNFQVDARRIRPGVYKGVGEFNSDKSMEEILNIINNYEEFCQYSYCNYHTPNLAKMKVFKTSNPNVLYTWSKIDNVTTSSYYSKVNVTNLPSEIIINSRMVTKREAKILKRKYGLSHMPIMDTTEVNWKLKQLSNKTYAKLSLKATTTSFILDSMQSQIIMNMKKTISSVINNIKR